MTRGPVRSVMLGAMLGLMLGAIVPGIARARQADQAPVVRPGGVAGESASRASSPAGQQGDPAQSEYSIYEQLTDDHRRRVDRAAKYYVRLDDGTCLNAFRLIRAIELRDDEKRVRREEMLEALGALRETDVEPPKPGNQRVKYEKLPNWVEYRQHCYVFGPARDMSGFSSSPTGASDPLVWLNTGRVHRDGLVVSFGSFTDVYIAGMSQNFAVPRRLEETILLAPSAPAEEGKHPPLKVYQVVGRTPTPQQLAEYLVKNDRPLIEYEIPKVVHDQPMKTRRVNRGRGWVENVSEPDGPPIHFYKWVKREFKLRLNKSLDKKPTSDNRQGAAGE